MRRRLAATCAREGDRIETARHLPWTDSAVRRVPAFGTPDQRHKAPDSDNGAPAVGDAVESGERTFLFENKGRCMSLAGCIRPRDDNSRLRLIASPGPAFAALLLLLACADAGRVALPAQHEARDPAVRSQIAGLERRVRELDRGGVDNRQLADAVGELGRLYQGLHLLDTHAFDALEAAEACYTEAMRLAPADDRWPYLLGFAAESRGDMEAAARRYREALDRRPELVPALQRVARAEAELGRPDVAASLWNRVLELSPDDGAALHGLGSLRLDAGDVDQAAALLERAVAAQPAAGRGRYSLALALRQLGDAEQAAAHFALASHTDFTFDDPLVRELAYLPSGSAALVRQGAIAVSAGEFAAAATLFGRAVDADPSNLEARRHLALAHADAGELGEAVTAWEELLALEPSMASAHFELGRLQADRGQPADAMRSLTRATELALDYKQAHYQLALLLERAGRPDDALERWERVLSLDPDYADTRARHAASLAAAGRHAEAIEILSTRLAAAPSDAASLQALSVVLRQQNRLEEAQAGLESGLAAAQFSRSDEARLRTELGGILAIRQQLGAAARELRLAVGLDPTEAGASFLLGMVLLDLRRPGEATAAFEAAIAVRPDLVMARLRLAALLAQSERCNDALALLDEGRRFPGAEPALAQAFSELRTVCGRP